MITVISRLSKGDIGVPKGMTNRLLHVLYRLLLQNSSNTYFKRDYINSLIIFRYSNSNGDSNTEGEKSTLS